MAGSHPPFRDEIIRDRRSLNKCWLRGRALAKMYVMSNMKDGSQKAPSYNLVDRKKNFIWF